MVSTAEEVEFACGVLPVAACAAVHAVGRFVGRRHAPLILRQSVAEDGQRPAGVLGGGDDQDAMSTPRQQAGRHDRNLLGG